MARSEVFKIDLLFSNENDTQKEKPRRRLKPYRERIQHTVFEIGLYSGDSLLALMGIALHFDTQMIYDACEN